MFNGGHMTTTATKPQHTPGPYRADGRFIMAGTRHIAECFILNRKGAVALPQLENAAYIAHAANAYPQLVAALHTLLDTSVVPTYMQVEGAAASEQARALLRSLGESA